MLLGAFANLRVTIYSLEHLKKVKVKAPVKAKAPGFWKLTWAFIAAKKRRVCPLITVED
jgi:hypothetical protein